MAPNVSQVTEEIVSNNLEGNGSNTFDSNNSEFSCDSSDRYLSGSSITDDDIILPLETDEGLDTTIARWAIRHSITHTALDDLLLNLSKYSQLKNLPKDSRTLLKTPTKTLIKNIKGGIYHHFGIQQEIEHMIELNYNLPCTLGLIVGIDGLPISKNPPSQLWPILGYFSNLENKCKVFIVGSYYGKPKPEDSNEFLQDFVNDLYNLINIGVAFNNTYFKVILKALICDTPPKSYILRLKGHTGKKSCVICTISGEYENNRVFFPNLYLPLRTHNDFIAHSDAEFHSGHTILVNIPKFDLVNDIPFDYIHCVCIGVMEKILVFWNGRVKRQNLALPRYLISSLNNKLND